MISNESEVLLRGFTPDHISHPHACLTPVWHNDTLLMCRITAHVGDDDDAVQVLLSTLENLEYHAYDSPGVAVQNAAGIVVAKRQVGLTT